jgi:spore coat protein U-like protein
MNSLTFFFLRALRILRPGLLALLLMGACVSPAAASASCNVYGSGTMSFGTVNVLDGGTVDSSFVITYGCSADPGTNIMVCASLGADPTTQGYDPRYLILDGSGGASRMAFNMYSDPARTTIWGAVGAPGSYAPVATTMTFGAGEYYKTAQLTIYGRIKTSGQSGLAAGYYSTNTTGDWPVKINYKSYSGAMPKCTTGGTSTSSSGFYISAQISSDCRLISSTNMDFGTVYQTLTQNVDSTAAIVVTCNGGQSGNGYHVLLGDGLNPVSSGGQRRMQGPNGSLLNYELYKDAARSSRWGNTDYLGVAGTGTGQPQTLVVYGRVPSQPVPAAGKYTDTVVITVNY